MGVESEPLHNTLGMKESWLVFVTRQSKTLAIDCAQATSRRLPSAPPRRRTKAPHRKAGSLPIFQAHRLVGVLLAMDADLQDANL